MVKSGDVIFCRAFKLPDGTVHDTWFLILNDARIDQPALCLKSTTKLHRYNGASCGCNQHLNCYYIPLSMKMCFALDTYLVLPELHPLSLQKLFDLKRNGNVEERGAIDGHCMLDILHCLSHYEDDIDQDYFELLFTTSF